MISHFTFIQQNPNCSRLVIIVRMFSAVRKENVRPRNFDLKTDIKPIFNISSKYAKNSTHRKFGAGEKIPGYHTRQFKFGQ